MTRMIGLAALVGVGLAMAPGRPDRELAGYRTAPGWRVQIAAEEPMVINPVTMTWGPDGRLYVVEWLAGRGPNDRIKVLTDEDGDGRFDRADLYMDGLDLPAGVAFWDGWTYVTLDHDVVRFRDEDGDGAFERRESIVTGFGNDDSHHRVSGLTFGPDGWLYMTTGDSDARAKGSDGSTATVLRSGGVFRCRPDGSDLEVFAFGMRNPWGNVAFDDAFRIIHTDNDNEGSPGFTGCRILHVVEGGDYGWRLREGARCCQPDFERATWNGERPGRLGWVAETGRGAPAGVCVLNSAAFPESSRNLVVYPDVFRKLVRAYRLEPKGATFTVAEEFELLASDDPLFRPDDAEVGPDGALYILDWRTDSGGAGQLNGDGVTGRIYRMTWAGTDDEPARRALPPDRLIKLHARGLNNGLYGDLIRGLNSDDFGMRDAAAKTIIQRSEGDPTWLARVIVDGASTAEARRHALLAWAALDPEGLTDDQAMRDALLEDRDPELRRLFAEIDARFGRRDDALAAFSLICRAVYFEKDPGVIRALLPAIGRRSELRRGGEADTWKLSEVLMRLAPGPGEPNRPFREQPVERNRRIAREALTADFLAAYVYGATVRDQADPLVLDAGARALERLGEAGVDRLVEIIRTVPQNAEVALGILQALRCPEALRPMLELATGRDAPITDPVRAGLFRSLRERVADVPAGEVTGWLAEAEGGSARVEAIRLLRAMGGRGLDALSPMLPGLLADEGAEVRAAALEAAPSARSEEAKRALARIVFDEARPAAERTAAVAALRAYQDEGLAPDLARIAREADDPGLLAEALRLLGEIDLTLGAIEAAGRLGSDEPAIRAAAIGFLGQKAETARDVAGLYRGGKIPKSDLPRVIEALRPHSSPEVREALAGLLRETVLVAPTGPEARELRAFVEQNGNADRGRSIYLDANKGNCASCHRLEGVGGAVGPDLTKISETLPFEKRLESIVQPSKEIKEGYASFKVATTDGRILVGLLVSDTAEAVVLKDAQGSEVRIPAGEIDEKGTDPSSLMPDGLTANLSLQELADLLAFLGNAEAQTKLRGE